MAKGEPSAAGVVVGWRGEEAAMLLVVDSSILSAEEDGGPVLLVVGQGTELGLARVN